MKSNFSTLNPKQEPGSLRWLWVDMGHFCLLRIQKNALQKPYIYLELVHATENVLK